MSSARTPDWPGWDGDTEAASLRLLAGCLAAVDGEADEAGEWPASLWGMVVEAGANRWAIPEEHGGSGCDRPTLVRRYGLLAEGSLTAAFILTQHDAAVRRLLPASGRAKALDWLRSIVQGRAFTTVGLSQLTTSRRHGEAALVATPESDGGYRLDGVVPWVTGAEKAAVIVMGAVVKPDAQVLFALPSDRAGVRVSPSFSLAALGSSRTAEIMCECVHVMDDEILAGPIRDVMSAPGTAGTGGLETSALALGQARAALVALEAELEERRQPMEAFEALAEEWRAIVSGLMQAAEGAPDAPEPAEVRRQANSLVLRATQAYLVARKGTGFLRAESAQRWARQALFFLVWSCPGPVAQAALRDLAGVCQPE